MKKEWADAHLELITEEEDNQDILFVYSDGSLSERKGRKQTRFGVIGYIQGRKVFERKEALGEHMEVYDMEMVGLHAATIKARHFIKNKTPNRRPHKIAFYADNTEAIHRIFKGSPGKAQAHSRGFRKVICNILNADEEVMVAISWCPGHQGIRGNEPADKLANSGLKLHPEEPNYKTQPHVTATHKCEM